MTTKSFFIVLVILPTLLLPANGKLSKRQISSTPTCSQSLYTGIVNENSPPGTFVVQATATSSTGQQPVWSIQDTTFQRFSINPATGAVSVAGSLARMSMQRSALEFRIRATDPINQLYCESTVRVNVLPTGGTTGTGTQPAFGQSSYTFVVGQATFGTPVGQVSITNPVGTTYYTLAGTSSFAINPQTGQITANANLSPGVYSFTVTGQNQYGTATATVTVQVTSGSTGTTGTSPSFSQSSYTVSASSCTPGATIVQVQAGGAPSTYYLSGTSQFAINPSTGMLTASQNLASGTYTFQIVAQNAYGQATATLTINANCGTTTLPVQPSSQYYVTQGTCPAGTQLGSICSNTFG